MVPEENVVGDAAATAAAVVAATATTEDDLLTAFPNAKLAPQENENTVEVDPPPPPPADAPEPPPPPTAAVPEKKQQRVRKSPHAPKRFKSSYICFFMAKQAEIKAELGPNTPLSEISRRSAQLWRNLAPADRLHWDTVAERDKVRYHLEKAAYTGPWHVPCNKRMRKDPSAPKRPMTAFLNYSLTQRSVLKAQFPDLKNTDISKRLGHAWNAMSPEAQAPYRQMEREAREKYSQEMAVWQQEQAAKKEAQRKQQMELLLRGPPTGPVVDPLTGGWRVPPPPYAATAMPPGQAPPPPGQPLGTLHAYGLIVL